MPILAPNSDVSATGWTSSQAGGLYEAINEAVASDAEYISTPVEGASPAIFGLPATVPVGDHTISVRASVTTGTASLRLSFLDASNVSQGESALQPIDTTPTTYAIPVTTTGAAVRVQFEVIPDLPDDVLRLDGEVISLDGEPVSFQTP